MAGLGRFSIAYACAWAAGALVVGPGSAAFVEIGGRAWLAGLYVALFSVSNAVGGRTAGALLERRHRPRVLLAAMVGGAAGFGLSGLGVAMRSTTLLVIGTVIGGASNGSMRLTRLVVADAAGPSQASQAIGRLQTSATVGAVLGPTLLLLGPVAGRATGLDPLEVVWWFAPPILLLGAASLLGVDDKRSDEAAVDGGGASDAPRRRRFATSALLAAQVAMVGCMGIVGAYLVGRGFNTTVLGVVLVGHVVGMFAFSVPIGTWTARYGPQRIILVGVGLLVTGVAVMATGAAPAYAVGLWLIGLGWSCAFLAGTVLYTQASAAQGRARGLGRIDMWAALLGAGASLSAGFLLAAAGIVAVGIAAGIIGLTPLWFRVASPARTTAPPTT